jgi:hypothetical protein
MSNKWLSVGAVLLLTFASGLMDARAFLNAAQSWPNGVFDARIALASILWFAGGISMYIVAVRFMQNLGVTGPVLQTALWFAVTAVGIAVLDGSVLQWSRAQQAVGVVVATGLGWLIVTTKG